MNEELIKKFQEMKNVDIRTVDRSTLVDRKTVKIKTTGTREEILADFIMQIGNPYCYLEGKGVTKLEFPETTRTIDDCMAHYFTGL